MARARPWVVLGLCLALITGCASAQQLPEPSAAPGAPEGSAPEAPDEAVTPERRVEIDGDELVLRIGLQRRPLATIDAEEGIPVHAALRPGDHDEDTVLVLMRVADERGERYELRYLVATEDTVGELYWFPDRLQVAPEVPGILDVAPIPVWSPEGDAIAWIEWVDEGTRLRTVGWIDEGDTRNPSDETSAYALAEVPAGVQLDGWTTDTDGDPVLFGRRDGQPYRFQLALGSPAGGTPSELTSGR